MVVNATKKYWGAEKSVVFFNIAHTTSVNVKFLKSFLLHRLLV